MKKNFNIVIIFMLDIDEKHKKETTENDQKCLAGLGSLRKERGQMLDSANGVQNRMSTTNLNLAKLIKNRITTGRDQCNFRI